MVRPIKYFIVDLRNSCIPTVASKSDYLSNLFSQQITNTVFFKFMSRALPLPVLKLGRKLFILISPKCLMFQVQV